MTTRQPSGKNGWMLSVCYLGWQGWLVRSEHASILVDPLLVDDIGRGGPGRCQSAFTFWPPRQFDWSKLPPIDAVFYTHEHEDHFNIASLARMSRDIPVLASARMSGAAKAILGELGFDARFVRAGQKVRVEELELCTFAPNLVQDWAATAHDEWDVLAFLFRHTRGDGVFFSNVDVEATRAMAEGVLAASTAAPASPSNPCSVLEFSRMSFRMWTMPDDFTPRTEDNQHAPEKGVAYELDGDKALQTLCAGAAFQPVAGQTVVMESGAVARVEGSTPFLETVGLPWPERPPFIPPFEGRIAPPACGDRDLPDADLPELERHLQSLAEYLYGRRLFQELNSLSEDDVGSRIPSFLFALIKNSALDARGYMYDPSRCAFVHLPKLPGPPREVFVGEVWGWATDLLALFRGEIEPRVSKGWLEHWHQALGHQSFWRSVLWPFFHPLRHYESCLGQYRKAMALEVDTERVVERGTARID